MSHSPRVSVIMIFLNAARFIEEAIASVEAQTYQDWELLLVDDGSTDDSSRIAKAAADRRPDCIRYLEHPGHENRGMSASRNLGIRAGKGELVAFLDADDVWLPEKLRHHVAEIDAHPDAAMVYGTTVRWFSWLGAEANHRRDEPRRLGVAPGTLAQPPLLATRFLTAEGQTPGLSSCVVRRSVIDEVGGFEDQFRGMYEDAVFIYKVCLHAPVFVDGAQLDFYRQHPGSFSQIERRHGRYASLRANASSRAFLLWLGPYVRSLGIQDPDFNAALRDAMWPYEHPVQYWVRWQLARIRTAFDRVTASP